MQPTIFIMNLYATWLSPKINQILAQMTHSCRSGRVSDSTCQEVMNLELCTLAQSQQQELMPKVSLSNFCRCWQRHDFTSLATGQSDDLEELLEDSGQNNDTSFTLIPPQISANNDDFNKLLLEYFGLFGYTGLLGYLGLIGHPGLIGCCGLIGRQGLHGYLWLFGCVGLFGHVGLFERVGLF